MHANDAGPPQDGNRHGGGRAGETVLHGPVQKPPEKTLPRGADHEGKPQGTEFLQPAEKIQVVLHRLSEPDPRIEQDSITRNPRPQRPGDGPPEKIAEVGDHVPISGISLHRPGRAEHVHEDDGNLLPGREAGHGRVAPEGGHVVEDPRPRAEGLPGDGRFGGVNGDEDAPPGQSFDHRDHPADLLACGDAGGPGAGRFPPDVDQAGALFPEGLCMPDGAVGGGEASSVGKGIGGDIEDSHDGGPGAEQQSAAGEGDAENGRRNRNHGSKPERITNQESRGGAEPLLFLVPDS